MKKVKEVAFYFENCDYLAIPIDYIKDFTLGSLIIRRDFIPHKRTIEEISYLTDVSFYFKESIDEIKPQLNKKLNASQKLKHKDITKIFIYYDDDTKDEYNVEWKEGYILEIIDDAYNEYQNLTHSNYFHHYRLTITRKNYSANKGQFVLD